MTGDELRLREREIAVKEQELELKKKEQKVWRNPLFLGLLAAALSIVGNAASNTYQARNAERLAKTKFQHELIFAALNANDSKLAAQRLAILIRLGYVDGRDMRVQYYMEYPERLPIGPWPTDKIGYEHIEHGEDVWVGDDGEIEEMNNNRRNALLWNGLEMMLVVGAAIWYVFNRGRLMRFIKAR